MSWNPDGWNPTGWQPDGWQPGDGAEAEDAPAQLTVIGGLTIQPVLTSSIEVGE